MHDIYNTRLAKLPDAAQSVEPELNLAYMQAWYVEAAILRPHYRLPYYRKLRMYAYSNRQRADALLVRQLREFAGGATLVIGDWSRPNQRFHEPTPGVGMVRMLCRAGLEVKLIDEYKTSKVCPACELESLESFRRVPSPRPWRKGKGKITCHGLLRCTSQQCRLPDGRSRLWNRDVVSVLNKRHIVDGLRRNGQRPERFLRGDAVVA